MTNVAANKKQCLYVDVHVVVICAAHSHPPRHLLNYQCSGDEEAREGTHNMIAITGSTISSCVVGGCEQQSNNIS